MSKRSKLLKLCDSVKNCELNDLRGIQMLYRNRYKENISKAYIVKVLGKSRERSIQPPQKLKDKVLELSNELGGIRNLIRVIRNIDVLN